MEDMDMTRFEVELMVKNHNNMIDSFIDEMLPKLLEMAGVNVTRNDDGTYEIPMSEWFTAQKFISGMNFKEKAFEILNNVRGQGFDVKIDMQSYKLVY